MESDVTLALTLQITARQAMHNLDAVLDIVAVNVDAWQGQPCVLVVHLGGATDSIVKKIRERLLRLRHDGCLVSLIAQGRTAYVSRKALMNMAVDAAPTRWVVSGIELERGLMVSKEAATLCRLRAEAHNHQQGQIFLLPQFAVTESEAETSEALAVVELLTWKKENSLFVRRPSDFEKGICEDEPDASKSLFAPVDEIWWKLTISEINGVSMIGNEAYLVKLAQVYSEIEKSLIAEVFTDTGEEDLSDDIAPVLMVDSFGPGGISTSTFVREVEELGGKQCYNSFRLAQLVTIGYDFNVLPGAFVASTQSSRQVALAHVNEDTFGASRCDGCIMFRDEDEAILETITHGERDRISKTAILLAGR